MNTPKKFSLQQRLSSLANAIRGIEHMIKTQHNAWIHAVALLAASTMAIVLQISSWEWCCLLFCFMAVFSAEAFNTALELICDLVSPESHPMVGKAKDTAAGAVLIVAIGSVIVGAIVFLPHIWVMM